MTQQVTNPSRRGVFETVSALAGATVIGSVIGIGQILATGTIRALLIASIIVLSLSIAGLVLTRHERARHVKMLSVMGVVASLLSVAGGAYAATSTHERRGVVPYPAPSSTGSPPAKCVPSVKVEWPLEEARADDKARGAAVTCGGYLEGFSKNWGKTFGRSIDPIDVIDGKFRDPTRISFTTTEAEATICYTIVDQKLMEILRDRFRQIDKERPGDTFILDGITVPTCLAEITVKLSK